MVIKHKLLLTSMNNSRNNKFIKMKDYEIIGWPEIQYLMDLDGFDDNAILIEENSSTYLINNSWLEYLKEK